MSGAQPPRPIPRSIGAVFVGVLAVIALSLGTDVVLHATGIYPPWFQPMADGLWVLALAYRVVYGIAGGYIAARLAPNSPVAHAVVLGVIGEVLSIVGVASHWNKGPEYGPKWFGIALIATALPLAWIGGKISRANTN
jgi:hypothetical protein